MSAEVISAEVISAELFATLLAGTPLRLADVGASYFMPDTWQPLMPVPQTRFVLFDPVGKNLSYAQRLPPDRVTVIPAALSRDGGVKELFLAHTDSGSSLYPPHPNPGRPRLPHDYFFPMRVIDVETKTLASSFDEHAIDAVHAIKLDTQGSELDIVRGLDARRFEHLLFVEMEVAMDSQPWHVGAARLGDVLTFFQQKGFRHVNTRIARRTLEPIGCVGPRWSSTIATQHECDVVLVRDLFDRAPNDGPWLADLRRLVTMLTAYYLHGEAIEILRVAANHLPSRRDELAAIEQLIGRIAEVQSAKREAGAFSSWHET